MEYFDQIRKHINESILESRNLVLLILRIYDRTVYLKAYKFVYIPLAVLKKFKKRIIFV